MGRMVRGIRGATSATGNTKAAVTDATQELMRALLDANDVRPEDIASIVFTTSPDLNAAFPAEAARALGLQDVPLLGAGEVAVPGSLPRCIRVLVHVNTAVAQSDIRHVYLRDAQKLRPDWANSAPGLEQPRPRPETVRIQPYVPGMSVEDARRQFGFKGSFVKLASNENPLGPSPAAVAAAGEALARAHTYPDGAHRRLRQRLGEKWGLSPDSFIVGNGSDGVIKMIGETYLQPGDDIVCADPTFSQYEFAANLFGARTIKVPLDGNWRHDLPRMAEAIGPRTKAIFVCNPNNPTGTAVTRDQFAAFMERVPRRVLVVLDEAYAEYTDSERAFGREWVEETDRYVIVLRTFSKIYGLATLRVGYGMARPEIVDALRRVQEPFQVNGPAQAAALAALDDEEHLETSRRTNDEGKAYFYERAQALGLEWAPTEANFVFVKTGHDSRHVAAGLLERGIIVRGGDAFGTPDWLRITIGTREENERLFGALAEVLGRMASYVT